MTCNFERRLKKIAFQSGNLRWQMDKEGFDLSVMERPTWWHLYVTLLFQHICRYFFNIASLQSADHLFHELSLFISNLRSPTRSFLATSPCIFLRKNACINISIPIQNLENVCLIWTVVFDLFLISLSVG